MMKTIARRRTEHLHAYRMLGHKKAERCASTIGSFSPHSPMRCALLLSLF